MPQQACGFVNHVDKNNFWRWACSDFLSNALRGVLAEYIVGKALDCVNERRLEWDAYDLVTADGIKIEVKSAAYIQTWNQEKYSEIRFDVAEKRSWSASTNTYSEEAKRSADIYIFCVLEEKDRTKVDPLDLAQWSFFVIPTGVLREKLGPQKTVSLATLEKLGIPHVPYGCLLVEVRRFTDGASAVG